MTRTKDLAGRLGLGAMAALLVTAAAHADERWREHEFREHEFHDHRYYDGRWHNEHYYPPRGFVFATIPPGFHVVVHRGFRFYFSAGVWYRYDAPGRYVVVAPPFGLIAPVPPPYYSVLYVNGAPYYYADNVYYVQTPQGYMVTDPPPPSAQIVQGPVVSAPAAPMPSPMPPAPPGAVTELPPSNMPPPSSMPAPPPNAVAQSAPEQLYIYPRQGQNEQQQAADRSQCHSWAVGQVGFDPDAVAGGQSNPRYPDFKRALTACLDAHGYTVR